MKEQFISSLKDERWRVVQNSNVAYPFIHLCKKFLDVQYSFVIREFCKNSFTIYRRIDNDLSESKYISIYSGNFFKYDILVSNCGTIIIDDKDVIKQDYDNLIYNKCESDYQNRIKTYEKTISNLISEIKNHANINLFKKFEDSQSKNMNEIKDSDFNKTILQLIKQANLALNTIRNNKLVDRDDRQPNKFCKTACKQFNQLLAKWREVIEISNQLTTALKKCNDEKNAIISLNKQLQKVNNILLNVIKGIE